MTDDAGAQATNPRAGGQEIRPLAFALRNRVRELRHVKASDIRRHPQNWRLHPLHQQGGLSALLEEIGFVGALIGRELSDGAIELIDGHLRADLAGDEKVPVLITDLTDDETKKVLLTFDPLGGLAATDPFALGELLDATSLDEDDANLRKLVADLHYDLQAEMRKRKKAKNDPDSDERLMPDMELQPHEHYDYLVVLCKTTQEWNVLVDLLKLTASGTGRRKQVGVGRGIPADRLFALLGVQLPPSGSKAPYDRVPVPDLEVPHPLPLQPLHARKEAARQAGLGMMAYRLVCATRKRTHNMPVLRALLPSATLCIDERELDDYARVVPRELIVTHPPMDGYASVFNWMVDHFTEPCLVCIDDDLVSVDCAVGRKRTIRDPDEILAIIENSIQVCDDLGLTTFCYTRTANSVMTKPEVRPMRPVQPVCNAYGVMRAARHRKYDPTLYGRSDVDWTLETLLKDRCVYTEMRFYFNCGAVFGGRGGNVGLVTAQHFAFITRALKHKWGAYVQYKKLGWEKSRSVDVLSINVKRINPTAVR